MLSHIFIIMRKELTDNLRDRRAVFNTMTSVLMNPILYILMFGFIGRASQEQIAQALILPVQGSEYAPNLIAYLEQQNIIVKPAPSDYEGALLSGDEDVVLVIPASFAVGWAKGLPVTVEVWRDNSNIGNSILVQRVQNALNQYSQQVGSLRLMARGVSPAVATPIYVVPYDISPQTEAGTILTLLPVIMLTAAFFGGFFMVVDMTAGERERDSLEPLLMNPVPRAAFVWGKYLAALSFTTFSTILATSVYLILLGLPQMQRFTLIRVSLTGGMLAQAILIMLPVVIMAVALEMGIASYARTVKEAQTYTQLLALAGFIPPLFLSILPIKSKAWMNAIPTIAQTLQVNKILRGDSVPLPDLALSAAVTLLAGVLGLFLTWVLYRRERILR